MGLWASQLLKLGTRHEACLKLVGDRYVSRVVAKAGMPFPLVPYSVSKSTVARGFQYQRLVLLSFGLRAEGFFLLINGVIPTIGRNLGLRHRPICLASLDMTGRLALSWMIEPNNDQ